MRFCLCCILFFLSGCDSENSILNGYVEAEYQYITSTTSGILNDLYVHRGDYIKAGTKLFAIDETELTVSIEKAKADICEAESLLQDDIKEYLRAQKMLQLKAMSQAEFDKKEATYKVSKAKLDGSKQNLLAAQKKLNDSAPKAITDAYVEDTFFLPGEFVQPGQAVVSLLSPDNIKIRFFISQKQLPKIKQEQSIFVSCDGSSKKIMAKITYIAKQAEYTPPVIYSVDSRKKMVFMVEAKPIHPAPFLHPGLPVDIELEGKTL
jgi:HlyD family secretion protein